MKIETKMKTMCTFTILAASFSLLTAQISAMKTIEGFEIQPNKLLTTVYVKDFSINPEELGKIIISEDCVKGLIAEYKPIFNNHSQIYENIAREIIAKSKDFAGLKKIVFRLQNLVAHFFKNYDYEVGLNISLSLVMGTNIPENNQSDININQNPYLVKNMLNLVNLAIRRKIGTYFDTDKSKILALPTAPASECKTKILETLDDNYIIAVTMCEMRELLIELFYAIN